MKINCFPSHLRTFFQTALKQTAIINRYGTDINNFLPFKNNSTIYVTHRAEETTRLYIVYSNIRVNCFANEFPTDFRVSEAFNL